MERGPPPQVCYPPFSPDAESRESYGPNNVFRWFELPEASVAQRSFRRLSAVEAPLQQ